ncbi:tautomerase family protein [Cupriavidus necator]|uniref:tautomerase family protein n=1 Tax=Cupriavidus necator TaxID=106590 RepID=UPI0039C03165
MPVIQITMVKGRPDELVKRCIKGIAKTVHETLGVPLDSVRVIACEVPATNWAAGAVTKDEQRAKESAPQ